MNKKIKQYFQIISSSYNNFPDFFSDIDRQFNPLAIRIQELFKEAHAIMTEAQNIVSAISSVSMQTSLDNLGEISGIMLKEIKNFDMDHEKMSSMFSIQISQFTILNRASVQLKRVVYPLRNIRVSIMMENARTENTSTEIDSLTNEIQILTNNILDNSNNISDKTDMLINMVKKNVLSDINTNKESDTGLKKALEETLPHLDFLKENTQNFTDSTISFTESIKKLFTSTKEIVISIQFHDIIRQKMEHIRDAFEDILKLKDQKLKKKDLKNKLYHITGIQLQILYSLRNELTYSLEKLKQNLGIIENILKVIKKTVDTISNISFGSGTSFLQKIENGMKRISDEVSIRADDNKNLTKTVNTILESVITLKNFLSKVATIADVIKMISFNARFAVQRLGEGQHSLHGLSAEVQEQAEITKDHTEHLGNILKGITETAQDLQDNVEKDMERITDKSDKLIDHTKKVLESISKIVESELNKLNIMCNFCDIIFHDISNDISRISPATAGVTFIEKMISELEKLPKIKKELQINHDKKDNDFNDKELRKRYTMQHERDIHDKFIQKQQNESILKQNFLKNKFGDNVDLF
ncbi:MAG: hypothetical protein KAS64_01065 [Spirochaetes bacterium]|nr:hypothetical protein [Spirochaetota bacterium]